MSQETLERSGWYYKNLDAFRNDYTRPLIYNGEFPSAQPPNPSLNFFFDENIPNLVQHALSRNGLYPDLVKRTKKISDYFNLNSPDLWFGIRDYTGFIPSLYCETLKSTSYRSFSDFYQPDHHRLDWNDVIDRMREVFPKSRIFIYRYEELRGNEAKLLSRVTDIPPEEINLPKSISRLGFSQAAINALELLSKNKKITSSDIVNATKSHPKNKENPSFQPFNDEDKERLREKYMNDVSKINGRGDVNKINLQPCDKNNAK